MLFNTLISFLLLALTPLFAFAQEASSSSTTTTVSTTVTSTATSYVTMTGPPPTSTSPVNGTITTPTPLASVLPGAAAGTFRASYGLGAGIVCAVIFGML